MAQRAARRTAERGYSIGDVAELTGVPASTLRAWESRYQLLSPQRTGAAYRSYSEAEVDLIRRMRLLVDSGVPARRAAGLAIHADMPNSDAGAGTPGPGSRVGSLLADHDALVGAARRYDPVAVRELLDEAFALASVDRVIDDWLMPTMVRLGIAWEAGEIDVGVEHFLTGAVMRRVAALFEATPASGPRVVVGLAPTSWHELPALAFALCLRRAGVDVIYLGPDVPVESWRAVIATTMPRAAVLAAAHAADVPHAQEAVTAIRRAGCPTVYVGGRAARELAGGTPLPLRLATAARMVATAIAH